MPKERLEKMIANGDGVQFSHTLDEQIGGQLKALYEDRDSEGGNIIGKYRCCNLVFIQSVFFRRLPH